jgi:hypothetical protein
MDDLTKHPLISMISLTDQPRQKDSKAMLATIPSKDTCVMMHAVDGIETLIVPELVELSKIIRKRRSSHGPVQVLINPPLVGRRSDQKV